MVGPYLSAGAWIVMFIVVLATFEAVDRWVKYRVRYLDRADQELEKFHEGAEKLIADPRTPDEVIQFLADIAQYAAGRPEFGLWFIRSCQMQHSNWAEKFEGIIEMMPNDLQGDLERVLAWALQSSASANRLRPHVVHAKLDHLFSANGNRPRRAAAEAEKAAVDFLEAVKERVVA